MHRKLSSLMLALALLTMFRLCAAQPAEPAAPIAPAAPVIQNLRQPLTPCDTCIPGVTNFAKVSPALWRGAQPTARGFKALEAAGVKTIVNLRYEHDDLPLLAGTRLKYLWLPSRTWDPEKTTIVLFLKAVADTANWPVYVHCAQGRDRTGYCVASYRMVVQGWSADEAIAEMDNFRFNKIWFGNPGYLRKSDTGDVWRRVQLAP